MDRRTYRFGESTLTVTGERIVDADADVIVGTDDTTLQALGGLSRALLEAGGPAVAADTAKYSHLDVGDVVVTTAGSLPARYLFHCITTSLSAAPSPALMRSSLRRMTKHCFELASSLQARTIAFPLIGGGVAGYPVELIAAEMTDVLVVEMLSRPTPLDATIHIYTRIDPERARRYLAIFDDFLFEGTKLGPAPSGAEESAAEVHPPSSASIAFFAADPRRYKQSRLGLGEEWRVIDDAIWQSEFRSKLDIHPIWATRPRDIQRWLNRKRPAIVHFAGHAEEDGSLVLDSGSGEPARLAPAELAGLLSDFTDTIRCVVLNACFSDTAAEVLAVKLPCIVGTTAQVQDSACIEFSASFYQAIGYGNTLRNAYEQASHQVPATAGLANLHGLRANPGAEEARIVA